MTAEHEFDRLLNANPDDWQTRLVFADWLQERDDPRAAAVRALGTLRLHPRSGGCWLSDGYSSEQLPSDARPEEMLPHDWWVEVCRLYRGINLWPIFGTRRTAEDAAILTWAALSPERRAELLAIPAGAAD